MKYPFLNTQQGGIQNSRRSSRLIRQVRSDHLEYQVSGPSFYNVDLMESYLLSIKHLLLFAIWPM